MSIYVYLTIIKNKFKVKFLKYRAVERERQCIVQDVIWYPTPANLSGLTLEGLMPHFAEISMGLASTIRQWLSLQHSNDTDLLTFLQLISSVGGLLSYVAKEDTAGGLSTVSSMLGPQVHFYPQTVGQSQCLNWASKCKWFHYLRRVIQKKDYA